MISFDDLATALAERKRRLLLVAETALPASQFAAFRKVLLDELGESGLLADLRAKRPHTSGRKPDGAITPHG